MRLFKKKNKQPKDGNSNKGRFVGFVLLSEAKWNKESFSQEMKEYWGIDIQLEENNSDEYKDIIIFTVDGMTATVSLFDSCVPNGEAEYNAKNNYMWKDAVAITETHKAHILVAVLGDDEKTIEKANLFVKIIKCLCKQEKALGIYTAGSVFHPAHYEMLADILKEDGFPVYNLIWFGLYNTEKGVCCYTFGMDVFGKHEMEVLYVDAQPEDIQDFLSDLVCYVIKSNVTLQDGETIGFSEDDIHTITLSDGVSLPQKTLKISYKAK